MKKLIKFKQFSLSTKDLQNVKGGIDCHDSYSESEVVFLMNANDWSKKKAKQALYLSCVNAATATRLPKNEIKK